MARDPYRYFRIEARELVDQLGQGLLELERAGSGGEVVPRLLRLAHTLKGAARVVRLPEIADAAHSLEDLLTPFRERIETVPRDSMEALLALVDGIARRVAGLSAPEPAVPAGSPAPAPSPEPFRAVGADIGEIDALFDGVSEAYAELNALRHVAELAGRSRRLAEQLTERLAATGDSSGAADISETLRGLAAEIERGVVGTHERVDREIRQVRDAVEQLRLVPASALFPALERAGRDSAQLLGKQLLFEGSGNDVRLDAHVVRIVQDALLQLVRNAVAHGIEDRDGRLAAGKPPQGRVAIAVLRRGRRVVFRCSDDGRGIDTVALRDAAVRKGRSEAEFEALGGERLMLALLQGGISTTTEISEVAGRGIGMDIVREAVARLGAEFGVDSTPGAGTHFELSVPLSVSSVEALLVEGGGIRVTLPLGAVRHLVRLHQVDIQQGGAGETVLHEGRAIPLVPLSRLLGGAAPTRRSGSVSAVVVEASGGRAALAVQRLLGTANIVFRALPDLAPATPVIAGASLDADGNPLLMLDPDGLVSMTLGLADLPADASPQAHPLLVIDDSLTTRMLEQSILESAGYEVDVAVSAEEGLERARVRDYALILVDVEMPGMDGFAFIEQIRRDPRLRNTPAILVTSRNAPEDKRRGQEVGAQGYVVKSDFDQGDLLERIGQLVG